MLRATQKRTIRCGFLPCSSSSSSGRLAASPFIGASLWRVSGARASSMGWSSGAALHMLAYNIMRNFDLRYRMLQ